MRNRFVPLSGVVVCGLLFGVSGRSAEGQGQRGRDQADAAITVLKPARVFDGDTVHEGWAVRVKGERIDAVGPDAGAGAPAPR